jgi:hypothetical protein
VPLSTLLFRSIWPDPHCFNDPWAYRADGRDNFVRSGFAVPYAVIDSQFVYVNRAGFKNLSGLPTWMVE